jgi:hypothetical protein
LKGGGTYRIKRACEIHSSCGVQSGKKSCGVNTVLRGQTFLSRVVVIKSVVLLHCCKTVNPWVSKWKDFSSDFRVVKNSSSVNLELRAERCVSRGVVRQAVV